MKRSASEENIIFLSVLSPAYEKYPMYDGLWNNWKNCGFTLFFEAIVSEIEKFFYDPKYATKSLNYPFISTFVFYLNEFLDVDQAFLEAGGLTTRYGLIWIRYYIQNFYNTQGKIPTHKDLKFIPVYLKSTDYTKFGYSSWERLIAQNLGAPVLKERWKGTVGFHEAKRRVKQFYDLHAKPPSAHQFPVLSENCQNKTWKLQGINNWRDFLSHVLKKTLKTYYKKTWDGALGLHRARLLLYQHIDTHGSIPAREKFHSAVQKALKEGRWESLGVHSWIDLLWTIHGLSSEQICAHIFYSSRNYAKRSWEGLDGMTDAMMVLFEYHQEHKKYPTPHDFPTIARMCRNRRWKRWGVSSWKDLMRVVSGEGKHGI